MNPVRLLTEKRNGMAHAPADIAAFIRAYTRNEVPDYQMSAWLMATYLNGLNEGETVALTQAMRHSGKELSLKSVAAFKVDKHSTGGVGDKITLCLGPLVAACGVAVPMVAGRGLGHTGGTLDKLEAIAGYRVDISARRFAQIVKQVGVSIMGQTAEIAPADKRIYALRDVTATVESIPLIVASILSKKLATDSDALVMDVKCGRGAFMPNLKAAKTLAQMLVKVGQGAGRKVSVLITEMSSPLGLTIGNALETHEAIDVLHGKGPTDVVALTLALGAQMLLVAGAAADQKSAEALLRKQIDNGRGVEVFARMVAAHGGDARVAERPELLPRLKSPFVVRAERSGIVGAIDSLELGLISVELGAGRTRADQNVDPKAGIVLAKKPGQSVKRGEPLAFLHSSSKTKAEQLAPRTARAIPIQRGALRLRRLVLERL
ncbi:MAG: thymidine phosphorylase [Polyangiaceae bacterium]|nr:thymidine phosphorylase [Polyangiaceae bacterium]